MPRASRCHMRFDDSCNTIDAVLETSATEKPMNTAKPRA